MWSLRRAWLAFAYAIALSASTLTRAACVFAPSSMLVVRVGDGAGSPTSAARVSLLEVLVDGTIGVTISLPYVANLTHVACTLASVGDGAGRSQLTADDGFYAFPCYNASAGIPSGAMKASRVMIAIVDCTGRVDLSTSIQAGRLSAAHATAMYGGGVWTAGAGGIVAQYIGTDIGAKVDVSSFTWTSVVIFNGTLFAGRLGVYSLAALPQTNAPPMSGSYTLQNILSAGSLTVASFHLESLLRVWFIDTAPTPMARLGVRAAPTGAFSNPNSWNPLSVLGITEPLVAISRSRNNVSFIASETHLLQLPSDTDFTWVEVLSVAGTYRLGGVAPAPYVQMALPSSTPSASPSASADPSAVASSTTTSSMSATVSSESTITPSCSITPTPSTSSSSSATLTGTASVSLSVTTSTTASATTSPTPPSTTDGGAKSASPTSSQTFSVAAGTSSPFASRSASASSSSTAAAAPVNGSHTPGATPSLSGSALSSASLTATASLAVSASPTMSSSMSRTSLASPSSTISTPASQTALPTVSQSSTASPSSPLQAHVDIPQAHATVSVLATAWMQAAIAAGAPPGPLVSLVASHMLPAAFTVSIDVWPLSLGSALLSCTGQGIPDYLVQVAPASVVVGEATTLPLAFRVTVIQRAHLGVPLPPTRITAIQCSLNVSDAGIGEIRVPLAIVPTLWPAISDVLLHTVDGRKVSSRGRGAMNQNASFHACAGSDAGLSIVLARVTNISVTFDCAGGSMPVSPAGVLRQHSAVMVGAVAARGVALPESQHAEIVTSTLVSAPAQSTVCTAGALACRPQTLTVINRNPNSTFVTMANIASTGRVADVYVAASASCPPICPPHDWAVGPDGFLHGWVPADDRAPDFPEVLLIRPTAGARGAAGGVVYAEECVNKADFVDGALTDCTNSSNPVAGRCAFGAGLECRFCSTVSSGAVCPGGFRAWPEPGYWTASEVSGSVIACNGPDAEQRCLGWSPALGASACGRGYKQGSPGCATCDTGYFPKNDFTCASCPDGAPAWLIARSVLILAAIVCGLGLAMFIVVLLVSRRLGGTVAGGAKRTLQFVVAVVVALQTIVQIGRAASPGLPGLVVTMYEYISVVQFEGITVHPACLSAYPFQRELSVFITALALLGLATLFGLVDATWVHDRIATNAAPGPNNGKRLAAWKRVSGLGLRISVTLLTVLYAVSTNHALSLVSCKDKQMAVRAYLRLDQSGGALSAVSPGLSLDTAQRCDALPYLSECAAILDALEQHVTVSVLSSNEYFVCGEGTVSGISTLAWVVLVVYSGCYPLVSLALVAWRMDALMPRDASRDALSTCCAARKAAAGDDCSMRPSSAASEKPDGRTASSRVLVRNPMLQQEHRATDTMSPAEDSTQAKLASLSLAPNRKTLPKLRPASWRSMVDDAEHLVSDALLAHFVTDIRASAFYTRHLDMLLLLLLAVLIAVRSALSPTVLFGVSCGGTCLMAGWYAAMRPYRSATTWQLPVKLCALLVSALGASLNFVSMNDATSAGPSTVALSYATFASSMLLLLVTIVSFLYSLASGAKQEQTSILVDAARAAAADAHSQVSLVITPEPTANPLSVLIAGYGPRKRGTPRPRPDMPPDSPQVPAPDEERADLETLSPTGAQPRRSMLVRTPSLTRGASGLALLRSRGSSRNLSERAEEPQLAAARPASTDRRTSYVPVKTARRSLAVTAAAAGRRAVIIKRLATPGEARAGVDGAIAETDILVDASELHAESAASPSPPRTPRGLLKKSSSRVLFRR